MTEHGKRVLELLASGLNQKEVAIRLKVSQRYVGRTVNTLKSEFACLTLAQLMIVVKERGLLK